MRILGAGLALLGLGIPIIMIFVFDLISLWFCTIFPIMIVVGYFMAFVRAPSTEKLTNRARRHLSISPAQSVLDFTSVLNAAKDDLTRSNVLAGRGEALMKLNRFSNALADFEACVNIPQPSQSISRGIWNANTSKANSMKSEIKQKHPEIIAENLDKIKAA